jgi:hypothetical protein
MTIRDHVQIYAGGEGSGCNPEVAEENGTKCGRPSKTATGRGGPQESASRQMVEAFVSIGDAGGANTKYMKYILDHGEHFSKVNTTVSTEVRTRYGCKTKECYYNAMIIGLMEEGTYDYYEGYATGVIPVPHAWVVKKGTQDVIDPTWTDRSSRPGDYFGVKIPMRFVRKYMKKHGRSGPLLPAYALNDISIVMY